MERLIPGDCRRRKWWVTAWAPVQRGSPWMSETYPDLCLPSQDPAGQNCQCTLEASETPPWPACCRLMNDACAFPYLTTFTLASLASKPEGQDAGQHYCVIIQHQKASCSSPKSKWMKMIPSCTFRCITKPMALLEK